MNFKKDGIFLSLIKNDGIFLVGSKNY